MAFLAPFAPAIGVLGAVTSAVGAIRQGEAQRKQAELQAGVLRQRAESERLRFEAAERDFRRAQDFDLASLRAARGASGVVPTPGPLLAFTREAELQALRIRFGGKTVSTRLEQQAQLQRFQGRTAQKAGFVRAGAGLLSDLSKVDFS